MGHLLFHFWSAVYDQTASSVVIHHGFTDMDLCLHYVVYIRVLYYSSCMYKQTFYLTCVIWHIFSQHKLS